MKLIIIFILSFLLYVIATNIQSGWLFIITAFLLSLIAISLIRPVKYYKSLKVVRCAPDKGSVNEPITVTLLLQNKKAVTSFVGVEDFFLGSSFKDLIFRVGPEEVKINYEIVPARRGIYTGGRLDISFAAPFGLIKHKKKLDIKSETTIYPKIIPISEFIMPNSTSFAQKQAYIKKRKRSGSEFYGVREYRAGESLRHVHWKATAKSGQLMLKEFEEEFSPSISIVVDLNYQEMKDVERSPLEDTLSLAVSIAHFAQNNGHLSNIFFSQNGHPERLYNPAWPEILNWSVKVKPEEINLMSEKIKWIAENTLRNINLVMITMARNDFPWEELEKYYNKINSIYLFLLDPESYKLTGQDYLDNEETRKLLKKCQKHGFITYSINAQRELEECFNTLSQPMTG